MPDTSPMTVQQIPNFLTNGNRLCENASFTYKDNSTPAIQNISFAVEGGKTIAIVGESGGGKSTLLKLLMRSYDLTSGTITIDGQNIRDIKKRIFSAENQHRILIVGRKIRYRSICESGLLVVLSSLLLIDLLLSRMPMLYW